MEDLLANPYFEALRTEHAHFAIGPNDASHNALRYPADIIPFAGLATSSADARAKLISLLDPGESLFLAGVLPPPTDPVPELEIIREFDGVQYTFPLASPVPPPPQDIAVRAMTAAEAQTMLDLTVVAFPGYFRIGTCVLGSYFGIYEGDELVAMAGERLALPGWREISAVCTHPRATGKGYAFTLVAHLLRFHRQQGIRSFLSTASTNTRAQSVYERLGFIRERTLRFQHIRRV